MSIRSGLLALLREEPKHGYQLKTDFESATGGLWKINVGQVYTTLDRLVRDGCVVAEEEGEQKRYRLSAEGREELAAWWTEAPSDEPPPRDELVVKVLLALTVEPANATAVIDRHRTALTEVLQRRRRQQRREEGLAERLATDSLVVRAEADLRWLDLCEARLVHARAAAKHAPKNGADR